jgi:septal ring factor EnvC (AmiA/AmiB activator)
MDDIDHLEVIPSLLAFYRSKINELQKDQTTGLLDRLKHVEMSAQERSALERELLEYEDDLDQTQQDIDHLRTALVRERRAVIQLVEENAQLRGPSLPKHKI